MKRLYILTVWPDTTFNTQPKRALVGGSFPPYDTERDENRCAATPCLGLPARPACSGRSCRCSGCGEAGRREFRAECGGVAALAPRLAQPGPAWPPAAPAGRGARGAKQSRRGGGAEPAVRCAAQIRGRQAGAILRAQLSHPARPSVFPPVIPESTSAVVIPGYYFSVHVFLLSFLDEFPSKEGQNGKG